MTDTNNKDTTDREQVLSQEEIARRQEEMREWGQSVVDVLNHHSQPGATGEACPTCIRLSEAAARSGTKKYVAVLSHHAPFKDRVHDVVVQADSSAEFEQACQNYLRENFLLRTYEDGKYIRVLSLAAERLHEESDEQRSN